MPMLPLVSLVPVLVGLAEKLFPKDRADHAPSRGLEKKQFVKRQLDLMWDIAVDLAPDEIEGSIDAAKEKVLAEIEALIEKCVAKMKEKSA